MKSLNLLDEIRRIEKHFDDISPEELEERLTELGWDTSMAEIHETKSGNEFYMKDKDGNTKSVDMTELFNEWFKLKS